MLYEFNYIFFQHHFFSKNLLETDEVLENQTQEFLHIMHYSQRRAVAHYS